MLATNENMPIILMNIQGSEELGIDTEATGLNVRNGVDWLTGIGLASEYFKCYIPFRHPSDNVDRRWIDPLFDALKNKPLDWHHRKFDMHSIRTLGVDPEILQGPHYDSMTIAHLVDEELPSKELDWLSKIFLKDKKLDGEELKALAATIGWGNIPAHVMGPYGEHDPDLHRRLKNVLWPKLVAQGLDSVYWDTTAPLTNVLYRMEQRGVGSNKDLAARMAERGRTRMATIHRQFKFNPASPVDLGNYLLNELGLPVMERTPKGKPSFNKVAMEQYDDLLQQLDNPAAQLITEYRGWQKAVTSLYEPLLVKTGPDGRIRTQFKEHGTVTGRLSSWDPNLQQIPRATNKPWNGHAKACFPAGLGPDWMHYGWDYSQIELRMSAAYGPEPILLDEFNKDGKADPFTKLTPLIWGEYSDEYRHWTKNKLVYPSLYGAGPAKVALLLGPNVDAARIYANYKSTIPHITARAEQVNQLMKRQKYISYWDGRRRHIKNPEAAHKAWNSLLQGGAAQMVMKTLIRLEKEVADNDCFPVLTVHDEISFCLRREALPDYEPKITHIMTDWPEWPVKFAVEGKEWK